MSNIGLKKRMTELRAKRCRNKGGDRYVRRRCLGGGYSIGGEQSGTRNIP